MDKDARIAELEAFVRKIADQVAVDVRVAIEPEGGQ